MRKPIPKVLAITGGKGGVGKTSVSVNLAIALSRNGNNVCLFDADTGLANINIMLGLTPTYTLEHLFNGEKSIQDIVVEGPEGVHLVPGGSGCAQCVELGVGQQQRLVSSLQSIEQHYDYMLVDTAAGISPTVLHFIAASQLAAVVLTPEPTSLTDAFSLLKVLKRRGYKRKVQVIVNMASSAAQVDKVYRRFNSAVVKYLDLKTEYIGSVWMDESMRAAVTLQRPVALFPKEDPSARSFYRLAERIELAFSQPKVPKLAFSAYWEKLVEAYSVRKAVTPSADVSSSDLAGAPLDTQNGERPVPKTTGFDAVAPTSAVSESSALESNVQKGEEADEVSGRDLAQTLGIKAQEASQSGARLAFEQPPAQRVDNVTKLFPDHSNEPVSQRQQFANEVLLTPESEHDWLHLKAQLAHFVGQDNSTPEQLSTLAASLAVGLHKKSSQAVVDLAYSLMAMLEPAHLSTDQSLMMLKQMQRLGVLKAQQVEPEDEVIEVALERYDEQGFGCQKSLADKIRNASDNVPLEYLLESIKQSSLLGRPSSTDDSGAVGSPCEGQD